MRLEILIISKTSLGLELTRTTSAVLMATEVPAPIAKPIVAVASAGESLTPSPMKRTPAFFCYSFTISALSSGFNSALNSGIFSALAIF